MTIETKFLRGKFYCYATVDGYDYSFDGNTVDEAQSPMRYLLDKKFLQGKLAGKKIEWESIKIIEQPEQKVPEPPYIGYASTRIDHNPFG
jgi:hypothetical protein